MRERGPAGGGDSGFTLIELMISLGLFALIAVAGLAMVDGILRVQGRTEQHLDGLAAVQRTVSIVTSDLDQISAGRIQGNGADLSFTRSAPGSGGPPLEIRYTFAGGVIVRQAGPVPQPLLPGNTGMRWRFRDGAGWTDRWPASDSEEDRDRWPRAVALELTTPAGMLRRVVLLPVRPEAVKASLQ